ncbi:hypothetical protein J2Y83_002084 [Pseudomonas marginalis]|nr:hypothetical protein [Pseudomonas marginalis]MCP1523615.1 hypothetical protein [Pseudomonas marginalis]MDQ0502572.1 hypothetical protein [Pseudomonas marginalis]
MLIAACSTVAHGLEQQRFEGLLHPRPISVGQLFTVHPWRQAGPDEHAAYILYLAYKQWTGGYLGQRIKPVLETPRRRVWLQRVTALLLLGVVGMLARGFSD